MLKNLRLIVFSAFFTALFFSVFIFFKPIPPKLLSHENQTTVGEVVEAYNDLQRKSSDQLIWQEIQIGDGVIRNDLVRTGNRSTGKIKLLDGLGISLEANTIVQIGKDESKVDLAILSGDLQLSNETSLQINLKAGKKQFHLGKGAIGIRKDEAENIELDVYKGEISTSEGKLSSNQRMVVNDGKAITSDILLKVLSPQNLQDTYLDSNLEALFNWAVKDSELKISIYLGDKKDELREVANQIEGKSARIKVSPGIKFWKVVAQKNDKKISSKIYETNFVPLPAPYATQPLDGTKASLNKNAEVTFNWRRSMANASYEFILAEDRELKKIIEFKNNLKHPNIIINELTADKVYFWKVATYSPDKSIKVESPIYSALILKYSELAPPEIYSPIDRQEFISQQKTNEVLLSWERVLEAKEYQLVITTPEGVKRSIVSAENQYSLKDLNFGKYQWQVATIYQNNKKSHYSALKSFHLKTLPLINWQLKDHQFFYIPGQETRFQWQKVAGAEEYHLKLVNQKSSHIEKEERVASNSWSYHFQQLGNYLVEVNAYNNKKELLAKSIALEFTLKDLPILEAPKFSSPQLSYKTSGRGDLDLTFIPLPQAIHHLAELRNLKGEIISILHLRDNKILLRGLYPGTYHLSLSAVDQLKRQGKSSPSLKVIVPSESSLETPKVKTIRVR